MDVSGVKTALTNICADGRNSYAGEIPSNAAIRTYRAFNRDITYRKAESKETAKFRGENFDHVNKFKQCLHEVEKRHPGIFDDPDRIWNMDEAHVDGEFGHRRKVFRSAQSHHGGFQPVQKGSGKHLTAVITASASGKLVPLFSIAAGKNVIEAWLKPLPAESYTSKAGIPHWLTQPGWMPGDCVIRCTENGSVDMKTLPFVIEHIDRFVRKTLPAEKSYLLFLDGHSSRKGMEWIDVARKKNIEVIILPANTMHFLQPCDSCINKPFQTEIRQVRDELCHMAITNVHSMGLKLKLAVAAYAALRAADVREAFVRTGIWPMDYRFADRLRTPVVVRKSSISRKVQHIVGAGDVSAKAVRVRQSDAQTYKELSKIMNDNEHPSTVIRNLSIALNEHDTVNSILLGMKPVPAAAKE